MERSLKAAAVLIAASIFPARAESPDLYRAGDIVVEGLWSRATPAGAATAAGYMRITNTGSGTDRLIGGSTEVSNGFEIHRVSVSGGVARMSAATGVAIGPGETVELKPGSLHAMFVNLKRSLKEGETIGGTLAFEWAGTVDVIYRVEGMGTRAPPGATSHMHH